MEVPLITVIIPVYNTENYLARCLNSVLGNTYRNLEVICVDDGSTDRSLEILREYEARDSRIVVITKKNGGVSSARNAGLDRVSGEYVSFVDPDDLVHPQYFELLLSALDAASADLSICDFCTVEDKDFPLHPELLTSRTAHPQMLTRTRIFKNHQYRSYIWAHLLKSSLIGNLRFREILSYSEDSVFFAEYAEQCPSFSAAVIPDKLYYYYQREDSLVKQATLPQRMQVVEIYVNKILSSAENDEIYLDQAVKRCLSTWYLSSHILPDREIARQCRQWLRPCMKRLRASSFYSVKEKVLYSLFGWCLQSYWLYRSITEPDMWAWEKVERKKRLQGRWH